jgi:DNA-binding LytR/AlgR family response regulator
MNADLRRPQGLIAEDEPVLREELAEQLALLWPELTICAKVEDGLAALRAIEELKPEIVFLDIQMPRLSGLEVARHASNKCHVAFVTAYDQYAVAAFDQGAVDYVVKPISPARLLTTVDRLKAKLESAPADLSEILRILQTRNTATRPYLRWINASRGSTVRVITVEEICYFKADSKYTLVVTPDAEALIKKPIKELHDELDPGVFWQIHRSTVINVNAIESVLHELGGKMHVRLKQRKELLQVSESYTHLFRQM